MRLTEKQILAVESGQAVRLRKDGLDCVVIRTDLYERVATMLDSDNPLKDDGSRRHGAPGAEAGRRVQPTLDACEHWTEEKNARRCELIDKDIEGAIGEVEKLELERLQQSFHEYLDTIAPLPIAGALRIHQELLEKQRQQERRS